MPILSDIKSVRSTDRILVECDGKTHSKCKGIYDVVYYSVRDKILAGESIMCVYCKSHVRGKREHPIVCNSDKNRAVIEGHKASKHNEGIYDLNSTRINIICDFQKSQSCKQSFELTYKQLKLNLKSNDGLIMCANCNNAKVSPSIIRQRKYVFNEDIFANIAECKYAYLLGWLASDGHISKNLTYLTIAINNKDLPCLERLRDIVCPSIPITYDEKCNTVKFQINSKHMAKDVCTILSITGGKKSHTVQFPSTLSDSMLIYFIRGFFDGDGSINPLTRSLACKITSSSEHMLLGIRSFLERQGIKSEIRKDGVTLGFNRDHALKLLNAIYKDNILYSLDRKRYTYMAWRAKLAAKIPLPK